MPPIGHAAALEGRSPLRIQSARFAVRGAWDALADSLVRTPAAQVATGAGCFAADEPTDVTSLAPWLKEATAAAGGGAGVSLRVELGWGQTDRLADRQDASAGGTGSGANAPEGSGRPDDGAWDGTDRGDMPEAPAQAVLQLTSADDPSLVIDAGDLFEMPLAGPARFGDAAERDLLLALRRGSRVGLRSERCSPSERRAPFLSTRS